MRGSDDPRGLTEQTNCGRLPPATERKGFPGPSPDAEAEKERVTMEQQTQHYDASQIQVLEGLEAVRRRPGMYIGSTDTRGLHHLVSEVVDNSIDEALAGYCTHIEVTLLRDGSISVRDNGRGIPVGYHAKTGKNALTVALTMLHAGGKFGGGGYKVSGGLHGVGVSCVNALSEYLRAEVRSSVDHKVYVQEFSRGAETSNVIVERDMRDGEETGTTITFLPDKEIFDTVEFDFTMLANRFREQAFLNAGVRISVTDDRPEEQPVRESFCYEGGIVSFVEYLNRNKQVLHERPVYFTAKDTSGSVESAELEVAMQYNDGYSESIFSYANNIATHEGGSHLDGFKAALTRVINDYARRSKMLKEKDEALSGEDIREGLTAIISVKLTEPQFEGQTKTKLGNASIRKVVSAAMTESLTTYLDENPIVAREIVGKCIRAAHAREEARKAREKARKTALSDNIRLPGKLWDCTEKDAEKCEIFIVEGDSAGGSAKSGRDPKTQAILPLRGKILNVEKARVDRMMGNAEILAMIASFGAGLDAEFDVSKLRYHKIICMTDADVDGAHIRILLLTFFFRHMRPLIEQGYVYIAMPPLFRVKRGKFEQYVYTDEELAELLNEIGREQPYDIQRYKGLGEMDPEQLWDTTMDPEKRLMKRVTMDDAMAADELFTLLMGDKVEPRRDFIMQNSKLVADLDY